jgi:hypothetical protein
MALGLDDADKTDLVEYLKSLPEPGDIDAMRHDTAPDVRARRAHRR